MSSCRQRALAIVDELGADFEDLSNPGELVLSIYAPAGHEWVATGCHLLTANYYSDRTAGWAWIVEELAKGVVPCTTPGCDVCAEEADG